VGDDILVECVEDDQHSDFPKFYIEVGTPMVSEKAKQLLEPILSSNFKFFPFGGENNMNYKFEILSTGSLMIRLPKEFDVLEAFLNVEVSEFGDWIAETVDKVLNQKSDYEKISANIFSADVRKDITFIFNKYDEDEIEDSLEIETITLRNLIDIWLHKRRNLKESK